MFGNKGIRKSSIYIFLALILPLCIVAITICFISLNKRNKQNAPAVDGKSAYEMALDAGFSGTEKEWLDSLKGTSGTSGLNAYEIAQRESNFTGTVEEFLASLVGVDGDKGDNGKNAYEEAKANGFLGTEEEFIEMLNLAIEKNAKGETGDKGDIGVSVTNVDASYELGNDGYTYLYLHYEFSNGSEIDKISKIGKKIEDFIDVYPSVIPYGSSNNPFFVDVLYQDGTTGTILLEKENFSRYNEYNTFDSDYSTYIDYVVEGKDNGDNIQLFNRDSNSPYKYITSVEFDANNFIFIPFLSGEYNENSDIGIDLNLYGTIHYNDGTSEYRYLKEGYNKNSEDRYMYDYHFRPDRNAYRSNYEKIWNKETETFDTRDYNYNAHYYVMHLDNSYQYKYQNADRRNDYIYKGSRNSSKYVVFYDPDYIDVVENRICPKPDAINRLKNRNQMYQISDNGSWTYFYAYDNKYPLTLSDLAAYDYNLRALFLDNFCIQTTYTDGHITYEDIPESLISSCSTNAKSVNSTYNVYFNNTIQGVNANRDYYYSSYQKPMDTFDSLEFEIVSVGDLALKPGELFTPPYRSKYKNISFINNE